MIYFPPLRRLLLPAIVFLTIAIIYRSSLALPAALPSFSRHPSPPPPDGIRVAFSDLESSLFYAANVTENHLAPSDPSQYYYDFTNSRKQFNTTTTTPEPVDDPALKVLWECPIEPNRYTNHIRISAIVRNISQIPIGASKPEKRIFWNPTIISLPYWAENQYLVVSRIVTEGNHQENVICEANICYVGSGEDAAPGEKPCTDDDLKVLGPAGGMRCASAPVALNVPPTPAEQCYGKFGTYVDVPGFHDPRIFWSGKGEPLMMVNTQSRYACFGLWIIDLRTLHPTLQDLLASSPTHPSLGPLRSYPILTELTRNPPHTRSTIEKNWFLFFTASGETYIHYDLSHPPSLPATATSTEHSGSSSGGGSGRTFAKLLGNGFTTPNLSSPLEPPCFPPTSSADTEPDPVKRGGTWHQATNSLRLILCNRGDVACINNGNENNEVFFAVIHRKFPNYLDLPLRYERHFMVWAATPPFAVLGVSRHPILMANETASGWSAAQNWDDDDPTNAATVAPHKLHSRNSSTTAEEPGKGYWAYFTYSVSIAYAWGREGEAEREEVLGSKNVGYLDDVVVLGVGVDDVGQGFARVRAGELVQCLRACPGSGARG
ncbi:MAG: hypothetical protein Q9220_007067 [cf. Caloplaca sp. 1 TL-2023]